MIGAEGTISLPLSKMVYGPGDKDADDKPQPSDKDSDGKKRSRLPTYIVVAVVVVLLFVLLIMYSRNSQGVNKSRYREAEDLGSAEEFSMVNAPDTPSGEFSMLSETRTRQKKDD